LILIGHDLTNMPDSWFALDSLIVVILTISGQARLGMFSGSISSSKSVEKVSLNLGN